MNAPVSMVRPHYLPASTLRLVPLGQGPRRPGRRSIYPVVAICAVQTALSLALVWSNTAYIDEADYLWVGRLEIAHWLHGTPWPSEYAYQTFSGSPVIYPPLGALANSIGGLAGARILSLVFMLGATVLLYLTASRLIGRRGAIVSAALWALSEPAVRLAFATFDPLSVFLTALSAWLLVQAGGRRRSKTLVLGSAVTLALANVTAYSGLVIDPVLIAFGFLVWLPQRGVRKASFRTAEFIGVLVASFGLLMIVSRSWAGLFFTVIARNIDDYQGIAAILNEVLQYSGLIIALAVTGSIVAVSTENRPHRALLILLGCAGLIVPVAQLHDQTAWSIDKHLAYGIWFAVIAAGYGCDKLIQLMPIHKQLRVLCCVIALTYAAASSWQSAWARFQAWPNANAFISAFKPVVAQTQGLIYVPGHETNIAEYYTRQGHDWTRWSAALSLDPAGSPRQWKSYYRGQLNNGNYGLIVLFYSTSFSSAPDLPGEFLLSPHPSRADQELLGLIGDNAREPGLTALTLSLENDPGYVRRTIGPYNSASNKGVFVIWQKKVHS